MIQDNSSLEQSLRSRRESRTYCSLLIKLTAEQKFCSAFFLEAKANKSKAILHFVEATEGWRDFHVNNTKGLDTYIDLRVLYCSFFIQFFDPFQHLWQKSQRSENRSA